jgi:hypothetical protein
MPNETRRSRAPTLTQRGAERRLAQEMAAGRITAQQFKAGAGALSKATIGAGRTTVMASELGLGGTPTARQAAHLSGVLQRRMQPLRGARRRTPGQRPQQPPPPTPGRPRGTPMGDRRRRLAELRRRLTLGF